MIPASRGKLSVVVAAFAAFFSTVVSAGWFGSDKSDWSEAEKQNFCHFLNSQQADSEAARISNSTSAGYATQAQVDQLMSLWRRALQEALQVSDSVLEKTHPDLKDKYRDQYQVGLQNQIAAFEQHNANFSITGSMLKADFVDWFGSARSSFKVPKGTVSACKR